MDTDIFDSRYSWIRLVLTLVVSVVGGAGMWIIIGVLPAMQQEFAATRGMASVPYVTTMLGFALGNLYVGRAVDRFGVVRALAASGVLMALAYGAAALAGSVLTVSLAQFFIGFGTSSCFGPLIADASTWFHRRRGIAVSVVASGNYIAGAVWPLLLGHVFGMDDWRAIYFALAVVTVVLMLPLALTLRRRVPDEARDRDAARAAARTIATGLSPRVLQSLLGIAGIACCTAMAMPQVHIVALCVDFGFGATVGAEMLSLMLVGGVLSRLVSGILADRIGGVATLLVGSTLQTVALFLYLPAGGIVSLYAVSLVFGLSQGGIVPSYAVIVREYLPPREAGARVGFVMMMTVLGMALGGWMSGAIHDLTGSYAWAFVNGIAWNVLNVGIVLIVALRGRSRPPDGAPA